MIKEAKEALAQLGLGGFYRKINDAEDVKIKGPYLTANRANPYGNARLPFPLSVTSEFHLRKPKEATPPDPAELVEIK